MHRAMMAVVAVVFVGCGVGPVQKGERYEGPGGTAVIVGDPELGQRLVPRATVEKLPGRETVRGRVELEVPPGGEGAQLSVMAGFVGCGVSVEAVGSAVVRDGRAFVRLNAPLAADTTRELYITLDRNGDGRCGEDDQMWTAVLTTGRDDVTFQLDLEELEAGPSWMCFSGWEE